MAAYVYRAYTNSDTTEGRGHRETIGFFFDEEDAVEVLANKGVMGTLSGTGVTKVRVYHTLPEFNLGSDKDDSEIWGHRKDLSGRWGYGYVDNRDAPINDPEYIDYLRLKEKFE